MIRRPDADGRALMGALLAGAILLSAFETLYALARGWDHHPGYFALSLFLTTAFAAAVGGLLTPFTRFRGWAVVLWVVLVVALVEKGRDGFLALVGLLLVARLLPPAGGRLREAFVGAGALGIGLVLAPDHPTFARLVPEIVAPALGVVAAWLGLDLVARALARASRGLAPTAIAFLVLASAILSSRSDAVPGAGSPAPAPPPAAAPSIVVVVLDTVGAGQLSLYGYSRPTTRALEQFLRSRANAVVYPAAFSNSPWTYPSHASLLTGLIPSRHGAHEGRFEKREDVLVKLRAPLTLAEALRARGYRTIAVFANRLDMIDGLSRGFDVYYQPRYPKRLPLLGEKLRKKLLPGVFAEARRPYPDASHMTQAAAGELQGCGSRPCFVLVNYLDAHHPYIPARSCRGLFGSPWSTFEDMELASIDDSAERLEHLRARHDEGICGLDRAVAGLLAALAERRVPTWVFITADHGEAFGEHGTIEHGSSVYNEQTHVPLIVLPPEGVRLPRISDPVSLIDVTATIAELTGIQPLGSGRSLLSAEGARSAPIEFFGWPEMAHRKGALTARPAAAVVAGRHKLISLDGKLQLFDLESDPGETRDLATQGAGAVRALARALPPLERGLAGPDVERAEVGESDRAALRALGYVE